MFNCGIRVNLRVFDFVVFKGNIQIHTHIYMDIHLYCCYVHVKSVKLVYNFTKHSDGHIILR